MCVSKLEVLQKMQGTGLGGFYATSAGALKWAATATSLRRNSSLSAPSTLAAPSPSVRNIDVIAAAAPVQAGNPLRN
jgi:hypothetical protein